MDPIQGVRYEAVPRSLHLAVLIDADNTSAKWADAIFKEVATLGEAMVRRIYGDFSGQGLKSWEGVLQNHALIAHQQFAHTKGKNSSDIALVIDAMDLLHTGRFDGFVLVSSDSDFTRLASRAREEGLEVFGIGKMNTPESLRKACKRFIFVENLLADDDVGEERESAQSAKVAVNRESSEKRPPTKVVPLVLRVMADLDEDEEGWIFLSPIGSRLRQAEPDFDARTYGYAKFADLMEKTGHFEVDRKHQRLRVRGKRSK